MNELTPTRAIRIQMPTVRRKHPWRWVAAAVIIAVIAGVIVALAQARIDWPSVVGYITYPLVLQAVWNTIVLAVVSQFVAIVLGVIVAVMRLSANPVAAAAASFFIWIFRGVPVLLQILIWYNLALVIPRVTVTVPFTDVVLLDESTNALMTPFVAAFLGLALNEAAYMAEIVRGGIKSVDLGQIEAASALGMSPGRTMRRITLPQALRVIIPPTGNDFVNMLKTTSLAAVVTYPELLRAAQNIASVNLQVMETLFAAAFWYMVIITVTSTAQYFLERTLDSSVTPRTPFSIRAIIAKALALPLTREFTSQPAVSPITEEKK
ncbi:amino acid ABC transporter permease [Agromyces sp. NPDC058484]|uniref:amino acid ABC transporter permease n=1 Tax=Agromyces sp. NPDC058484 TaxID=3346524 RepID=UPI0036559E01